MLRKKRRVGIERRILLSILWVGITPITLVVIIGYVGALEYERATVERTLEVAAEKTVSGVNLVLEDRVRSARILSQDADIVTALMLHRQGHLTQDAKETLKQRLLRVKAPSGEDAPSTYILFDERGKLVLATREVTLADLVYERQVVNLTEPQFISFSYDPGIKGYAAAIAAPVHDPDTNDRIGFVCERQDVTPLIKFTLGGFGGEKGAGMQDTYQIAVVSRLGGVAIQYLNPETTTLSPFESEKPPDLRIVEVLAGLDEKEPGSLRLKRYNSMGATRSVVLTYRHLLGEENQFQAYLIVYRSVKAVFSTLNAWALGSILGSIAVIGLFCIIAYRHVHNNIVRPLALLNEGAQIIRQGDLELKLKIGTGDEIEELAASFNKMALALKQNIRQLGESEEKYRGLVTSMRDGIYQTDREGRVTFINPTGAEIFGFDRTEDAIGQRVRGFFLEADDLARIADEILKRSFIERTRIWMQRTDGRAICVELSGNSILDDAGEIVGAEGIFRDVTRSVRLEQQARERAQRISAINQIANVINSSLEAGRLNESLLVELRKVADFDYAAVSKLDEQGTGFETRQLWPELGPAAAKTLRRDGDKSCAATVAQERKSVLIDDVPAEMPAFVDDLPEGIRSCLCVPLYAAGRVTGTLNLGARRKGGFSHHDMEVLEEMAPHIAVAMRNASLLENLQHSLEDVTRAREQLHEANEELKTLDEMKTNLLSNVSHELRTPLVAVMGYADMLFNAKVGAVNDVQKEYLGIILRNVEKLVTLIENLLDFSRLHRGAEKLLFATFDLVECARAGMQTVRPVADSREIRLDLAASDDEILVEGDRGKMGQVFNNLLSNAVKFNTNGGRVTVEIRRREDSVEVAVSDTGIGIPEEALDKVFTRFYQYDSSSTRKYSGTGIGLSIAQDVIRLHGSRITVTSQPGKGSTFRFDLPVQAGEAAQGGELPITTETHLLIELVTQDRALNVHLRDLVAPEGMDIVHAANAEYAIALARRHSPDCMLIDLGTNESNQTLLNELLEDPVASAVPIVILTNDEVLYERYRPLIAARVKRGFRKSGLLGAIQYALSQGASVGEPLGNKILCVDDEPEVVSFITRCLETEGCAVDACTSGQEALERLATHEYGLVLLDVAMPGLDGWEVCRQIRADATLAGLKVYLVTAKPVARSPARVQEVGADGYILKPFRHDRLAELAREFVPLPSAKD